MNRPVLITAALVLTAALSVPQSAHAASIVRVEQNGAGACQGALPAFSGTLRARPLALQNEGADPAFVTCSLETQSVLSGGQSPQIQRVRVYFKNNGTAAVTFSCTLVDGQWDGVPVYVVKSTTISQGGGLGGITFEPTDYLTPPTAIRTANISCALPGNVGITTIWTNVFNP